MSWKILLMLVVLYFLILVLGGLGFHYLEHKEEEKEDAENLVIQSRLKLRELMSWDACPDEVAMEDVMVEVLRLYDEGNFSLSNSSTSGGLEWDIPNSMFFAATLATTIGYGNMAPVTQIGRAFCVFYAFVSIPVCLVMLGGVGHSITQLFNKLDKKMDKCKNPKAEKITKSLRSLTTLIIGMGLFMFLPAGAFMYMENWSYPDSLYYVFITLTTVGLGDLVAGTGAYESEESRTSYQLSVSLWIMFGLAWLSTVIAMAQDFFQTLVDKVDDAVIQHMTPHLQQLIDKMDYQALAQLKLPNMPNMPNLDRLRRPSNIALDGEEGPADPDHPAARDSNPNFLSPDHYSPNRKPLENGNAADKPPPSPRVDPVVEPKKKPSEEDPSWKQPPLASPEADDVWQRRPNFPHCLTAVPQSPTIDEAKTKPTSKPKKSRSGKKNKVDSSSRRENEDIV